MSSEAVKFQRALRLKTFLDGIPGHPHPQCRGIFWIISYIYNYVDEPLEPPEVSRNLEGHARLTWLIKDAYLAISVQKNGNYFWFYKDNEWRDHGELAEPKDYAGYMRLITSINRLAERYDDDFEPPVSLERTL